MLGITSRLRQHRALFAVCLGLSAGLGLNARAAAAAQAAVAPVGAAPKAMAIGGIDVQKDGAHRTVRIKTSADPTFTVFRLNDPMRVIIDISGGDVSAMHGPLIYEDGVLDQVALRQYEADGFVMGRVIVGFDHPCSYDVQTDGHDVILRADGTVHDIAPHLPAAPAPLAADEPRSLRQDAPASPAARASAAAPEAAPKVAVQTQISQAPAQAADKKAVQTAEPVVQAIAAPKAQEPATQAPAQSPAKAVMLTGVRAQDGGVQLLMSGSPSYTTQQLDSPPRLVIDIAKGQNQTKSSVFRMSMPWLSRVRLGEQTDGLRVVFDLKDGKAPLIEASTQGLRVTAAQGAQQAAKPSAPSAQSVAGQLLDVRFNSRQTPGSAQTRIELKLRGDVQAQVDTSQDRAWVLQLSNATVAKELQRSLDTSAYPGVVSLVSTFQAEDEPPRVNVVVSLTGPATQRLRRLKNRWVWEIDGDSPESEVSAAAPKTAGFEAGAAIVAAAVPQANGPSLSGKRISLDVKDADIINVLRLISEETGENIIASDEVKGKVTLKLRNVPAEQALDTMLRTKGFDKVRQNNILRIASAEAIQKERDLDLARRRSLTEVEDTLIKMVTVNYATAGEIHDQIKPMLSPRGSVQVDGRTNTLILQDISSNIDRLVELSRRLDKQTPLVNIQARIVEATTSYLRDLGVQWGGSSQETARTGNATGLSFPGDIIARGGADDPKANLVAGISTPANYAVNLPAALNAQGGGIGFLLGSAGGSQLLNLRLTAMESNGNGKIISSPEISTLDNKTARVSQGVDIPISVVSAAGTNTRFQSAVLELEVTPHVTNDGTVLLKIHVQKSQPDFTNRGSDGNPTIQRKQAETEVLVKDGDTSVIGGIYTRDQGDSYSEIPFLARIPLLGNLFREHQSRDSRSELLVFITPRIINRDESVVQSGSVLEGAKN